MEDITFDDFDNLEKTKELSFMDNNRERFLPKLKYLLDSLDEYQRDIVWNKDNNLPLKITAGAGAGKTMCLLAKALKMVILDRINPSSIVLITFTNKAANEIRERYIKFFKEFLTEDEIYDVPLPHISTIHSFSCTILYKLFGIRRTILGESQSNSLLKSVILEALKINKIDMKFVHKIHTVISEIHSNNEVHYFCVPKFNVNGTFSCVRDANEVKLLNKEFYKQLDFFSNRSMSNRSLDQKPDDIERVVSYYGRMAGISVDQLKKIITLFLTRKYASNVMDFADMQYITFFVLNQYVSLRQDIWNMYQYFVVDESQDLTCLEFGLMVSCDEDSYSRFFKGILNE